MPFGLFEYAQGKPTDEIINTLTYGLAGTAREDKLKKLSSDYGVADKADEKFAGYLSTLNRLGEYRDPYNLRPGKQVTEKEVLKTLQPFYRLSPQSEQGEFFDEDSLNRSRARSRAAEQKLYDEDMERKKQRTLDFDKKKKVINEMTGMQLGTYTLENQFSDVPDTATQTTDTATQTTDTAEIPKGEVTDEKIKTDIGTLFTKKAETKGVETKYNNISKAVNEHIQYGSPIYNAADQTTTFNISDQFRSKSQAHIQIASAMTANDNTINQLDVVSRSKQELDNQTVIPFKVIAMSLGNKTEYR